MTSYFKVFHDGSRAYTILPYLSGRAPGGWTVGEDGGRRWTVGASRGPGGFFAVDAERPDVLYVAYQNAVFRSEDGGITKTPHALFADAPTEPADEQATGPSGGESARDISIGGRTGTAWIVTQSHSLYRSDGDLTTWRRVGGVPTVDFGAGPDLVTIAASQADSDVVFVVARDGHIWAFREPRSDRPAESPTIP